MGDVVQISSRQHSGNGAREAVKATIDASILTSPEFNLPREDRFLALLWARGFKIVPLDGSEQP